MKALETQLQMQRYISRKQANQRADSEACRSQSGALVFDQQSFMFKTTGKLQSLSQAQKKW
jgi:hypothetical protein